MEYTIAKVLRLSKRYKPLFIMLAVSLILMISYVLFILDGIFGILSFFGLSTLLYFLLAHRIREMVFLALVLIVENIFYIFNRSHLVFIYDLKQLVGFFLIIMFIIYLPKIVRSKFLLFNSMMLFIGYQVISVVTAYFTIGQPLIKGIYNLMMPAMILIYFFGCFLIEDLKRYEKFKTLLIYCSILAGFIYMLQALVYPKIIFLSTDFRYRYGNIRFTEFTVFMLFCAFITMNELLVKQGKDLTIKRFLYSLALFLQLGTFLLISQSRFITLTSLMLFGAALTMLQRRIPRRWIVAFLIWSTLGITSLLIFFYLMGKIPRLDFIFETIEEIITVSGNLEIRSNAVTFFLENLKGHWIFGWGSLNIDFPRAMFVSGRRLWHYMVDVGIVGYTYQYGLLGSLVSLQLVFKSLQLSWRIYKKNRDAFFPLLCNSSVLINCMMVFFFQETMALFYVGLIYVFMEFEYRKAFENERGALSCEDSDDLAMSDAPFQSGQ